MKKTLSLITLALLSTSAFANYQAVCKLNLHKNKVSCPPFFFFGCDESPLEKSEGELSLEVTDVHEGKIEFKHVAIRPESDDEKNHSVILLADDNREEVLKKEKKVKLISYKSANAINYKITNLGDSVQFDFSYDTESQWQNRELILPINGRGQQLIWIPDLKADERRLVIDCKVLSKEINNEERGRKEALEKLKMEEKEESAKKQ